MPKRPQEQLQTFRQLLEGRSLSRESKLFGPVVDWVRRFPEELSKVDMQDIRARICITFGITQEELNAELVKVVAHQVARVEVGTLLDLENEFDGLLPSKGYFRRYIEFTRRSEAPLVYHFFCALVGLAATINRRVWFDMGYYRLFPSMGVIILGPSGLKKTSAANIIVDIIQELQITKVYSEKLTPEALVEAMKGEQATGLIYAPEMSVFLSRQRYMEGIIPLITRFMDCPDHWESGTIMRGKSVLRNVAISTLMCTTPDWFVSNTPEDTFGGGFVARNILVLQNDSPRSEPIPEPGDPTAREKIMFELAFLHSLEGEISFDKRSKKKYFDWYKWHKDATKDPEHELLSTYLQRKPDHAKRIAILFHIAEHGDLNLCSECFDRAVAILDWTEKFLPSLLKQMFRTQMGAEQDLVLRAIRTMPGGVVQHSDLVRRMQYRMNAQQLRAIIGTLKEGGRIEEWHGNLGHLYKTIEEPM
jgi:hypothetical protein